MIFLNKIENEDLRKEIQEAVEAEIAQARESALNNPEFVRELKSQGKGEAARKFKQEFKKTFNLDTTELEGVEAIEDMLKIGLEKVKKDSQSTNAEWQDKYLALKEDYTRVKEEEIPALRNESEAKIKQFRIESALTSKLSSYENLSIPKEDLPLLVKAKMQTLGVNLDLTDNGISAITKDGTKPLIDGKAVDFDGLLNGLVSPYIKQNGAGDGGGQRPQNPIIASDTMSPQKLEIINKYKEMGVPIPEALLK